MSEYTNDTYNSIWLIENWQGKDYRIVRNSNDEYKVFCAEDTEEISYTNFVVKKNYTRLNGRLSCDTYYFETLNNFLHSDTEFAICCPCGLEVYRPHTDTTYYLLNGKILSRNTWLDNVRDTESWPKVIANILSARIGTLGPLTIN